MRTLEEGSPTTYSLTDLQTDSQTDSQTGRTYLGTKFTSISATLWWSAAAFTTTGYGDVVPLTGFGRFYGGMLQFCVICTLALKLPQICMASTHAHLLHHAHAPPLSTYACNLSASITSLVPACFCCLVPLCSPRRAGLLSGLSPTLSRIPWSSDRVSSSLLCQRASLVCATDLT